MEEKVENKENNAESLPLGKKYVYTWRNKLITSGAGSIEDFIATYKHIAEKMRRWKEAGIILDPDIDGGIGDDYSQFCTHDEGIAIKEGFEEEIIEEYEEDLKSERSAPPSLEFQINEYLSLKLYDRFIKIYVNGESFNQCRYLLIVDPLKLENQDEIDSIDEAESIYNKDLERKVTPEELGITKEQEFWAHCSNLQAWAENDYDTRLLHSNLSFPLLRKLTKIGDAKALKVFKEEIAQRFVSGYIPVMKYLFTEKYVDCMTPEEFEVILNELDYNTLDLNLLLENIGDYRDSKYGTLFLLRIRGEFLDHFTNNKMYVEAVFHHLDASEFSPIVVTPNRQYFIRGSNDGKLKVFGIFNADLVRVFGDHKGQCVSTLAISRDGRYVASSSDTLVNVWDYETGILLHSFEGHEDYVNALTFDPEGGYLVSGSGGDDWNESAIKIWDLNKGKLKRTVNSHWKSIISLSFSPNGKYLVSGARDKTVNVWDTINGRLLTTLAGHKNSVIDVAITNEKKVVSASYDDTIKVWDADSGEVLREMEVYQSKNSETRFEIVSFVLTPDHEFVIGGLQGSLKDGGKLCIWKLSNGKCIQALPIKQDFAGAYEELNQIAISSDGLFVFSASRDRMVKVWMEFIEYMDFQEFIQDS